MRDTLIVLGIASLFILGVVGTVGARELRPQLRRATALVPLFMARKGKHRGDPARAVSASARRKPPGVETLAAAGTVPDAGGAWPGGPASGTAGPHLLTTAELAALHPRAHRPVNGRLLGDQPRTYGQVPVATVLSGELDEERRAARAAGEWARRTGRAAPASPYVLGRVLAGLQHLPGTSVIYRHCEHCNEDCTVIHAGPCEPGCPGAEPIGGAQ